MIISQKEATFKILWVILLMSNLTSVPNCHMEETSMYLVLVCAQNISVVLQPVDIANVLEK